MGLGVLLVALTVATALATAALGGGGGGGGGGVLRGAARGGGGVGVEASIRGDVGVSFGARETRGAVVNFRGSRAYDAPRGQTTASAAAGGTAGFHGGHAGHAGQAGHAGHAGHAGLAGHAGHAARASHVANAVNSLRGPQRARGGREANEVQPPPPQPEPTPPAHPDHPLLPASWPRCVQSQPDFDHCLRDALQNTLPQLAHGVPELGLPPLEPAEVPGELVAPAQPSRVHLSLALSRVRAHGLTRAHILSVFSDLKHGLLDVHVFLPWKHMEADFKAQGQILDEPVDAHGHVNITLHGVELFFGVQGALEERSKYTFFSAKHARLDILSLQGMHARFEPLDPDPHRSETLNALLDSQSKALWVMLRGRLQELFAAAFRQLANLVFEKVPLKEIFLDEGHPAVRRWQDALVQQAHEPPAPWLFTEFK